MFSIHTERRTLAARLHVEEIPYVLCGALALAVHGCPRATLDIDGAADMKTKPTTLISAEIDRRLRIVSGLRNLCLSLGRAKPRPAANPNARCAPPGP